MMVTHVATVQKGGMSIVLRSFGSACRNRRLAGPARGMVERHFITLRRTALAIGLALHFIFIRHSTRPTGEQ